jgi:hypothetical protein
MPNLYIIVFTIKYIKSNEYLLLILWSLHNFRLFVFHFFLTQLQMFVINQMEKQWHHLLTKHLPLNLGFYFHSNI